ncbi:helix-turn-helix domain-containing protein [Shivajiella indica]|uniref:Helix-turn-helix domain-containing protein n=1 Tax=Shivajiella indica TaxID=872115 RepID=A0ABW5B723_9BACT
MEIVIHFKDLVYLGSQFLGLVISVVLLYVGLKKYPANILLGLSFFTLTYGTFIAWLVSSGNFVYFPQLYRTGNFAGLLFPPFFYLYIRAVLYPNSHNYWDFAFFLPALLFVADYSHVIFGMSVAEKKELIMQEIYDPQLFVAYNQSLFLPKNFHTLFRTFVILFFWILSFRLLIQRYHKQVIPKFEKPWLNWMLIYLVFSSLMIFPFLVANLLKLGHLQYDLAHLTGSILVLGSGLTILFFPKVLYGHNEFEYLSVIQEEVFQDTVKTEIWSSEKSAHFEERLKECLDINKSYLKKGYTLADLAKDTRIPSYQLTHFINHVHGSNFYDLINRHRIEETCRIIESGQFQHLTLEALAEKSGFNNRNSFSVAFKKFKGMRPSEFLRSIQKS